MFLRVQYSNSVYDYVDSSVLERLIVSKGIKRFLRPFENTWVNIDEGPTRENKTGIRAQYAGPERRKNLLPS